MSMLRKNRRTFTDEQFIEAVSSSYSIAQVLVKLNLEPAGANYRGFKKVVKELGVDTSHFTGQGHLKGKTHNWSPKIPLEAILVEDSPVTSTNHLKKRLVKEGLLEYKCDNCDIVDWDGKPIALHMDHINGVGDDNRLENLRLLCPNCHSQTDTFAGKNIGVNRKDQREKTLARREEIYNQYIGDKPKKSQPRLRKTLICPICNKEFIKGKRKKFCSEECQWFSQRKVERPTREQLQEDMNNLSWLAMARKYGVSDNAVRKWAKGYKLL